MDNKWSELRQSIKELHDNNLDKPDVAEAMRYLLNLMDVILSSNQLIGYQICSDAMLKMWMEDVLTDGEYNRVMDKLNKAHRGGRI